MYKSMLRIVKARVCQLYDLSQVGSLRQNLLIVFTGTSAGFLIRSIAAPIVSRIYAPEAYGEYALYNIILNQISMIGGLALPQAFILPKHESKYIQLSIIFLTSGLITLLLGSIAYLILGDFLWNAVLQKESISWIWLIIPALIFSSLNSIFNDWNVRVKKFRINAVRGASGGILSRVYTILHGLLLTPSGIGLALGDLVNFFFGMIMLPRKWMLQRMKDQLFKKDLVKNLYSALIEYKGFPLYILPGLYLNLISIQVPILLIASLYGKSEIGIYTFAIAMLDIPIQVIVKSIQPVFLQRAVEIKDNLPAIQSLVKKIAGYLLILTMISSFTLIIAGEFIFQFIFGSKWILAGTTAAILSVGRSFGLISSSLNLLRRVYNKEQRILFVSFLHLFVKLLCLVFIFAQYDFLIFVSFVAIGDVTFQIYNLFDLFKLVNLNFVSKNKYLLILYLLSIFGAIVLRTTFYH